MNMSTWEKRAASVPAAEDRVAEIEEELRHSREGDAVNFDRITVEPEKLEGKPCIRGLRISVETVVRLVAAGWTFDEILPDYPDLEREDIRQALEYAAVSTNVHVDRLDLAAMVGGGGHLWPA